MEETIRNKVSESGLVTLDLEEYYPKEEIVVFDLKEYLFMNLILKEKDFRTALQNLDWKQYDNKNVALTCTADAIIPMWAYMLVASYLQPVAREIVYGGREKLIASLMIKNIGKIDVGAFEGKRVVIKGCGNVPVPEEAYVEITKVLRPFVKSLMFGEPCSTVPVYKKK